MIVRSLLENYFARISSEEATELRTLAASQDRHSELCDVELEKIKQHEEELVFRKKQLIEQQLDDEFDQDQYREIQQQIRKLFLQEKEWEYRKVFHDKIKSICLFLSQHLKSNIQKEIVELTQTLLDQMIDLYFSSKNRSGRVALSRIDIKLQEATEAKDQTQISKYMIRRKICTLHFAISERHNEFIFATIKALLLANKDAEQYLDKLESEQEVYLTTSRICIYSMQDILKALDEPGDKNPNFLDKVQEVFVFAQQQCFVASSSLLELNRSVQALIEPNTELEGKQLLLKKIKCECRTHIYNLSIDLYLCELDILQNMEPRFNEHSKLLQEQIGIFYEEIFQHAIKLERILEKIQQLQSALESKVLEEHIRLQLLHQQAQLKSELLINILHMGKAYLDMYTTEQAREEKFARFDLIFKHYKKEHRNKYIYSSETQLSISMQLNLAMRVLFAEYHLLSELLAATLSDFQITTEILNLFPVLEAEDDDWSDAPDDNEQSSGMNITPPPIPVLAQNRAALAPVTEPLKEEEELPIQQDTPPAPPAPERGPSPAGM